MKDKFIWFFMASMLVVALGTIMPANADTIITTPAAVTTTTLDASNLCPTQVLYERRTLEPTYVVERSTRMVEPTVVIDRAPLACPAPMVIEKKRSHFLRFGLGPIVDFGLF